MTKMTLITDKWWFFDHGIKEISRVIVTTIRKGNLIHADGRAFHVSTGEETKKSSTRNGATTFHRRLEPLE
jgi:hypothetical protein